MMKGATLSTRHTNDPIACIQPVTGTWKHSDAWESRTHVSVTAWGKGSAGNNGDSMVIRHVFCKDNNVFFGTWWVRSFSITQQLYELTMTTDIWVLLTNAGVQKFSKNLGSASKFWCQKGNIKNVPYWGHTFTVAWANLCPEFVHTWSNDSVILNAISNALFIYIYNVKITEHWIAQDDLMHDKR